MFSFLILTHDFCSTWAQDFFKYYIYIKYSWPKNKRLVSTKLFSNCVLWLLVILDKHSQNDHSWLFKMSLFSPSQENVRETFRLMVLAHRAHAEVNIIVRWHMKLTETSDQTQTFVQQLWERWLKPSTFVQTASRGG